ncbi:MAG: type II toxin-antitoxin system prevent-host-death family antitoxin [bacterium]|nr:type II toxin-antitoxin system prevent-host-death family antitoxin [bacterium]
MSIKTNIIGFKDLRENANKYINAVARGKSFTVVRRSKPIFNIIPIDEWGDEGKWETVVDFTKFKKGGVKAEEVLASLRRLRAYE